jgi:uncharacterized RDD family membrane protein YckC
MNSVPSNATPRRLRRFACMMYEAVLLFGVVFLAGYLFDTLTQSRNALMLRHVRQGWLFLALGIYFILCWRRAGQTLPMKTWHIRLVDQAGNVPALPRLILRYVLAWLLPLAAALAVWWLSRVSHWPATLMFIVAAPFAIFVGSWFDADGQFLHDRWAGTRLITASPAPRRAGKASKAPLRA